LGDSRLGEDLDLTVLRLMRDGNSVRLNRTTQLAAGDAMTVEGQLEDILRIKERAGIEIKADVKLKDPTVNPSELQFVETIVLPRSPLLGRTLKGYAFRERHGLQVIGINRRGETMHRKISATPLMLGDILLLQGSPQRIAALKKDDTLQVIGAAAEERPKVKMAPVAIAIFLSVLALPTLKLISLPVAVMLGVAAVFLTRCVSSEQAYAEIEWRAVILIACMLSLGAAMEHTGAAHFLAAQIVSWVGVASPDLLLTGFFVLTVVLTQPMSNQAAAIVVLPIALHMAVQLGLNPRTFAMMVAVAASCSYMTPLEPSCLMVYGPGRYRFADFMKVGALLTALIYLVAIFLGPRVWPLHS